MIHPFNATYVMRMGKRYVKGVFYRISAKQYELHLLVCRGDSLPRIYAAGVNQTGTKLYMNQQVNNKCWTMLTKLFETTEITIQYDNPDLHDIQYGWKMLTSAEDIPEAVLLDEPRTYINCESFQAVINQYRQYRHNLWFVKCQLLKAKSNQRCDGIFILPRELLIFIWQYWVKI